MGPIGLGDPVSAGTAVDALTLLGGELYAGGTFAAPPNGGTAFIARWDGTSWKGVGGGVSFNVRALTSLAGEVYAGGVYTFPNSPIAKWNGTSWLALTSVNGTVLALAARGTRVYAGGEFVFTAAGGQTANRIAYWDTADSEPAWHAMSSGLDGTVLAIAITESGKVYAGGKFTGLLAWWNESVQAWVPVSPGPSGGHPQGFGGPPKVSSLAARGENMYVGGRFTMVGSLAVHGLAKWSGSTWSGFTLPPWTNIVYHPFNNVAAIDFNGANQMYVTGQLSEWPITPSARDHVYVLENGDNGTWSTAALTPGLERNLYSGDFGRALAVDRFSGRVYIAGFFDKAGDLAKPPPQEIKPYNVAVWNDFENITIVDLGQLGGNETAAYAINQNSRVTGYSRSSGSHPRAFRWDSNVMTSLGTFYSANDGIYGNGLNDLGDIVGVGRYADVGDIRGLRWTQGATPEFTVLNGPTGWGTTDAQAINKSGQVVG